MNDHKHGVILELLADGVVVAADITTTKINKFMSVAALPSSITLSTTACPEAAVQG